MRNKKDGITRECEDDVTTDLAWPASASREQSHEPAIAPETAHLATGAVSHDDITTGQLASGDPDERSLGSAVVMQYQSWRTNGEPSRRP